MQGVDEVIAVDWSASGVPKAGPDSIWIASSEGTIVNPKTRLLAHGHLRLSISNGLAEGRRMLLLFDFAFGGPRGLAQRVTGQPSGLALWDWLHEHHRDDDRNRTNYRDLAARMNALFDGEGPFWGNGQKTDIPGLPRKKPALPEGLEYFRLAEKVGHEQGLSPKPLWQLAGAGAVGAQSLTGMASLAALRNEFAPKLAVWPFEDAHGARIVVSETYLSLLPGETERRMSKGLVKDAAQASAIAEGFRNLDRQGSLPRLFLPEAPPEILAEEGWYLGAGQARIVQTAFA